MKNQMVYHEIEMGSSPKTNEHLDDIRITYLDDIWMIYHFFLNHLYK